MLRLRPTLGQAVVVTMAGVTALLAILFVSLARVSERGLIRSSEERRHTLSARIVSRVDTYLSQAEQAVSRVESRLRLVASTPDPPTAEGFLFAEMLDRGDLAELAFTRAHRSGFDADGMSELLPADRFQVSVYRDSAEEGSAILTRETALRGGRIVVRSRLRGAGGGLRDGAWVTLLEASADPTTHGTFRTPASKAFVGQTVWSDLSQSELDSAKPENQRRVVVTVMRAVEDRSGAFIGVLRAAILDRALDTLAAPEPGAPERTFLCDEQGRLLTRFSKEDVLKDEDGDLRVSSKKTPPEVVAALARPELAQIRPEQLTSAGRFEVGGRAFLFGFEGLEATQGWRLGMVVAEDDLPGLSDLRTEQRGMLGWALVLMAVIVAGGVMAARFVGRDLGQVLVQSRRMSEFDFAPTEPVAAFREVETMLISVEQAKTSLRALGKYVPVDLVRQLFKANREPVLGGELRALSVMFTDIAGFTQYAELLSANALADALGRYLEAMTTAVHSTGGMIDKYIGDAVMALWNAPLACEGHERRACRAALDCIAAAEALYASPSWGDRPRFLTRVGIHTAEVMVGHFGAPNRMSYTALGDGVNLAARLESLNKQYGTSILLSEASWSAAKDMFVFRRLDRVAVKGKSQGTAVFELLGDTGLAGPRIVWARGYERALDHYTAGEFSLGIAILETQAATDPPSAVLLARCRAYLASPPPEDWDGVYVARSK